MRTFLKAARFGAALSLATALVPAAAHAQAAGGVLVVDMNAVIDGSAAGKGAVTQLKTKYDARLQAAQASFNSAQQAFQTQVQTLQKAGGTPTPAARQAAETAQTTLQQRQQAGQQLEAEVSNTQSYVQQQILRAVQPILEQVRAQRRAAVVVLKNPLLPNDPAVDITQTVLQQLDASLKTVSITPPAAAPAAGGR